MRLPFSPRFQLTFSSICLRAMSLTSSRPRSRCRPHLRVMQATGCGAPPPLTQLRPRAASEVGTLAPVPDTRLLDQRHRLEVPRDVRVSVAHREAADSAREDRPRYHQLLGQRSRVGHEARTGQSGGQGWGGPSSSRAGQSSEAPGASRLLRRSLSPRASPAVASALPAASAATVDPLPAAAAHGCSSRTVPLRRGTPLLRQRSRCGWPSPVGDDAPRGVLPRALLHARLADLVLQRRLDLLFARPLPRVLVPYS